MLERTSPTAAICHPQPPGVFSGERRSREFGVLASGLDGSMPLTVSWPPSRNHPLPLFLSICLSLSLSLSRLYPTANHNAKLFIQDYMEYYVLNVAIRFLTSAASFTSSLSFLLSFSQRSNTKENDKGETLAEMVYSEKLEKTHSIERSVIFTRETILGFSSLLKDLGRRRQVSFQRRNEKCLPCVVEKQSRLCLS